ncbi:MAG: hypothetical protein KatS3mg111_0435 [Pirellulaceae bacterium]|nr:MAG: hypothetical protein KatS3mg111_0435 [Pirellulaceae bacterium]
MTIAALARCARIRWRVDRREWFRSLIVAFPRELSRNQPCDASILHCFPYWDCSAAFPCRRRPIHQSPFIQRTLTTSYGAIVPTVLITSGEHYGAVLNLDFDYGTYLEELQRHGLNHTRTFSGAYREVPSSFGITDNPLAPKPMRYACPWARSDEPGYYDGGNKFDLTKWDPHFFRRLHDFLRQAQERGVVVELNLFCPFYKEELWEACPMNARNNVNGVGDCPRTEVYTLKHPSLLEVQTALVEKLVTELRDYDNLYYEVCNEPYFGGVTVEWQHHIVDTIVDVETRLGVRHLISMNIANGRAKVEAPHPEVSIFNFHYCVPPDVVAMNYDLNRPIGENETGFRGRADVLYRTEAWDFMLAGGALFNNLDYSFTPAHPDGSLRQYDSPGGGSVELRQQLGVLKRFLESFDFLKMRPDSTVVHSTSPKLTSYALSQPGVAYAIYLHVPLPHKPERVEDHLQANRKVTVKLDLPAGDYRLQWIDPVTGRTRQEEKLQHPGGPRELPSPPIDNDVAIAIRRL